MSNDKADVRRNFEHGEWYWLWADGPDGAEWMLGKAFWRGDEYLSVLLPDDACTDYELESDGRLHKWHVLACADATPPAMRHSLIEKFRDIP